jgi:hypothetical protein
MARASPKKRSPGRPKKRSPGRPKKRSPGRPKKRSPGRPKKRSPGRPKKSPVKKRSPGRPKSSDQGWRDSFPTWAGGYTPLESAFEEAGKNFSGEDRKEIIEGLKDLIKKYDKKLLAKRVNRTEFNFEKFFTVHHKRIIARAMRSIVGEREPIKFYLKTVQDIFETEYLKETSKRKQSEVGREKLIGVELTREKIKEKKCPVGTKIIIVSSKNKEVEGKNATIIGYNNETENCNVRIFGLGDFELYPEDEFIINSKNRRKDTYDYIERLEASKRDLATKKERLRRQTLDQSRRAKQLRDYQGIEAKRISDEKGRRDLQRMENMRSVGGRNADRTQEFQDQLRREITSLRKLLKDTYDPRKIYKYRTMIREKEELIKNPSGTRK